MDLIFIAALYIVALYLINLLLDLPVRHFFDRSFGVSLDTEIPFIVGGLYITIFLAVVFPYSAVMESSRWQATFGKILLGNKVTDLNGNRITLLRSTGRMFARGLSGMVLDLGYWMALFTKRKQTLHDILAETIVLN